MTRILWDSPIILCIVRRFDTGSMLVLRCTTVNCSFLIVVIGTWVENSSSPSNVPYLLYEKKGVDVEASALSWYECYMLGRCARDNALERHFHTCHFKSRFFKFQYFWSLSDRVRPFFFFNAPTVIQSFEIVAWSRMFGTTLRATPLCTRLISPHLARVPSLMAP